MTNTNPTAPISRTETIVQTLREAVENFNTFARFLKNLDELPEINVEGEHALHHLAKQMRESLTEGDRFSIEACATILGNIDCQLFVNIGLPMDDSATAIVGLIRKMHAEANDKLRAATREGDGPEAMRCSYMTQMLALALAS